MGKRYGFPRAAVLRRSSEFLQVSRSGLRLAEHPLLVRALRRNEGQSRLGMSIAKQTGSAVIRNRWRRAIREAFRLHRRLLAEPYDLVIIPDRRSSAEDVSAVQGAFLKIIEELNRRRARE